MSDPAKPVVKPEGALWNAEECGAFLGVSSSWVNKRAQRGQLPAIRIGGALRFDPEVIRAFVRGEMPESKALVRITGPK